MIITSRQTTRTAQRRHKHNQKKSHKRNLFLPKEQPQRHPLEVKRLPQLILQIVFIRLFDIIREIAKERE
jgi:hypothetical protein